MELIHEAIRLIFEICMYVLGIIAVLYIVWKLKKANAIIENAKGLPGGSRYIHPMEEEAEYEEMSWKANA